VYQKSKDVQSASFNGQEALNEPIKKQAIFHSSTLKI